MSKPWRYLAGEPWKNRVTVFVDNPGEVLCIRWYEGGRPVTKTTGTRDRFRAVMMAEERAAEILQAKRAGRRHYAPDGLIAKMRQDLHLMARRSGVPKGHAPTISYYREHGKYEVKRVCSAFRGYLKLGPRRFRPADGWMAAMRLFGFTPFFERFHTSRRGVLNDLRRVAMACGHPRIMPSLREYDEHGKWAWTNVRRCMGRASWAEIADAAGLEMLPARRAHSERLHGRKAGRVSTTECESVSRPLDTKAA